MVRDPGCYGRPSTLLRPLLTALLELRNIPLVRIYRALPCQLAGIVFSAPRASLP
jgi:hypothetical protein